MQSLDFEELRLRAVEAFKDEIRRSRNGKRLYSAEQRCLVTALTFEPGILVRDIVSAFGLPSGLVSGWRTQMRGGAMDPPECQQRSLFDPLQRGVFAPPYGGVSARCGAPVVRRTESGSHRAAMFYLWS